MLTDDDRTVDDEPLHYRKRSRNQQRLKQKQQIQTKTEKKKGKKKIKRNIIDDPINNVHPTNQTRRAQHTGGRLLKPFVVNVRCLRLDRGNDDLDTLPLTDHKMLLVSVSAEMQDSRTVVARILRQHGNTATLADRVDVIGIAVRNLKGKRQRLLVEREGGGWEGEERLR